MVRFLPCCISRAQGRKMMDQETDTMELVSESSVDRITNLPADVIQRILVLLPIKDAARMATLSTKWRRHWRRTPQLVFDADFVSTTLQGGIGSIPNGMMMFNKLMFNVYRVLLLHDHDAPITKFVLVVPGLQSMHYEYEIDQIILYLSCRGLQEFFFGFASRFFPRDDQVYKLHSALFSCVQLTQLSLAHCELRQPSSFVGFPKLVFLQLLLVILPGDFYENFLRKCPMLRSLFVTNCEGPITLQLVAPCLREFTLCGEYLQNICFKYTPLLQSVWLHFKYTLNGHQKPADTVAFFASLPALQILSVDFRLLLNFAASDDHINVPDRLPTPLHRLTGLQITNLDLGSLKKARAFVCLIMSSPNLHELSIKLDTNQHADNNAAANIGSLLGAATRGGGVGCCFRHLRVFIVGDCLATQMELDLVRFVLGTVPLLEKVYITSLQKLRPKTRFKFMKQVMSYPHASSRAAVICD